MRPTSAYLTALLLSTLAISACALMPNPLNQPLNRANPSLNAQSHSLRSVVRPEVVQIPSPNHNERPANAKINTIVLHHTAMAGDARAVARFFANPKAGASSHYIVDRDGSIVQPVADDRRSWHAGKSEFNGVGDVNNFSIGIEICNVGDSQEPYSDAQYDGIIRLVGWLVQTYQVPLNQITRHRDVAVPKGRKIDTSNNFAVERVVTGVRALLNGTYAPPATQPPVAPPALPAFRHVVVEAGQKTFEDLADVHLDNPNRWVEIQALNPGITGLKPGQTIKIPNHAELFAQLAR